MMRTTASATNSAAFLAILVGLALTGCRQAQPAAVSREGDAPVPLLSPDSATAVQGEMRNVDFHIDDGIVMHIDRLRGALLPARPNAPPLLDDKQSFTLSIHTARIGIDTASLSKLLNRHVFGYPNSPLKDLRVTTDGDQLIQHGKMRGMPFRIRATISLTPAGQIRLLPTAVKVLGVKVGGLMRVFGIHLKSLITLRPGYGARIDEDDFILDPTGILPAPHLQGRLTAITVEPGRIVQTFGGADSVGPLQAPDSANSNYMYFQGGTLHFGKLTMVSTDLQILDDDPSNPFDFSLDRYNDQLVAGYSKNTVNHGLVVHMPDYRTIGARGTVVRSGATR